MGALAVIDATINLGHALTVLGIVIGFYVTTRINVKVLSVRMDKFDDDLREIRKTLSAVADQKSRLDVQDERIMNQGRRLDEWIRNAQNDINIRALGPMVPPVG